MMDINNMIAKYHISLYDNDKIKCEINHDSIVQSEVAWIKEHKSEIMEELNRRAEIAKAEAEEREKEEEERNKVFKALKVNNPEMRRGNRLTEWAISLVIDKGSTIEGAQGAYRSLYADVMDSHF